MQHKRGGSTQERFMLQHQYLKVQAIIHMAPWLNRHGLDSLKVNSDQIANAIEVSPSELLMCFDLSHK